MAKCERRDLMETIGIVLALGLGLLFAIFAGWLTGSVVVGIIAFVIGSGYLFGEWIKAGVPYDINEIKRKMK